MPTKIESIINALERLARRERVYLYNANSLIVKGHTFDDEAQEFTVEVWYVDTKITRKKVFAAARINSDFIDALLPAKLDIEDYSHFSAPLKSAKPVIQKEEPKSKFSPASQDDSGPKVAPEKLTLTEEPRLKPEPTVITRVSKAFGPQDSLPVKDFNQDGVYGLRKALYLIQQPQIRYILEKIESAGEDGILRSDILQCEVTVASEEESLNVQGIITLLKRTNLINATPTHPTSYTVNSKAIAGIATMIKIADSSGLIDSFLVNPDGSTGLRKLREKKAAEG